jgi:hypothetical protein
MATPFTWRRMRERFGLDAAPAARKPVPWWVRAATVLVLVAIIAAGWWWGFDFGQIFGGFMRKELEARIATLEAEATKLRAEVGALRGRASRLESELAISRGTEQALTRQTADLAAENVKLKEEAAFLQRLVADAGTQAELSVRRLAAEREAEGVYRYSFLVVRGGNPRDEFLGHAVLQAVVSPVTAGGEALPPHTLILPADQPESRAGLALKFKYYQRVEGMLRVPPGARLTALTAQVYEDGGAHPRATRSLTNP